MKNPFVVISLAAIAATVFAVILTILTLNDGSGTETALAPSPVATATPTSTLLYQEIPIHPVEVVNAQGTAHTEPFKVVMPDGTIKPLEDPADFIVLKTPSDGTGALAGTYFENQGLTKTYMIDDGLQKKLEADYVYDCQNYLKCQWVEYTLENGKLTRNPVGERPELLRTPTPALSASRTP